MKTNNYKKLEIIFKYLNIISSTFIIFASFLAIFTGLKYRNEITSLFKLKSYNSSSSPFEPYKYEERLDKKDRFSGREIDKLWAEKLLDGGYILHFRHTEREKWIDVEKYDSLESDVHINGKNGTRFSENDYFSKAVCLNSRGKVQARAIGEHLKNISFPIGYIISSPSCRARQTAELGFGKYSKLDRNLVHAGPYSEDINQRAKILRDLYLTLPLKKGKNSIVSSHNGVLMPQMFDNVNSLPKTIKISEGGFYVISRKSGKLVLEHEFDHFRSFIRHFYKR